MAKKQNKEIEKIEECRFSKEDILMSSAFTKIEQDFLTASLSEGTYTISEAKTALNKILKGVVK